LDNLHVAAIVYQEIVQLEYPAERETI